MARIEARYDLKLQLTLFSVSGSVTADELISAIETNYGSNPTTNTIWDLTQCALSGLDVDGLVRVSDCARQHSQGRKDPRTVFVVRSEQEAYLVKLYGEISAVRGSATQYDLVSSLDEAYAALAVTDPFAGSASSAG